MSLPSTRSTPMRTAVEEPLAAAAASVKPRLRGWLHAGTAPIVLAAGIVLVALAPTHQRDLPPLHLGTPRGGGAAPDGPRQHLRLHRCVLHPDGVDDADRQVPGGAAGHGLDVGARRAGLPVVLAVGPALALHRPLPADGLGGHGLDRLLLRQRRAHRAAADPGRWRLLHRWGDRLRAQAA